jgi:hypothetical protein
MIDVRFGSEADICGAPTHVRFTPNSDRESGLRQTVMLLYLSKRTYAVQWLKSALGQKQTLRRLLHTKCLVSVDHLVRKDVELRRNRQTQCLGGLAVDY